LNADEIARPAWMTEPETLAVLAALRKAGFSARFVGGCVRDTLLDRTIGDIDIATDALPDAVVSSLQAANLRAIPTGIDHGTITAVAGGKSFEITTLRHDVETDGRRAKVQFTDDWQGDAARRDLTINAMSLDADGKLYDPFGGREDLAAGRIRFVGDARDRIVEDVLRLLRYFRFYAHYGRPPPNAEALDACRALAPRLPGLSGERVRTELVKLLEAPDPLPALGLMRDNKVLDSFLPDATALSRLGRLVAIEAETGAAVDPMRRLAALSNADAGKLANIGDRLRLSNAERGYLATVAAEPVSPELDASAQRRLIYRLGAATFRELALLAWSGADDGADWAGLLRTADAWTPKSLPLTGGDVLERGIARGPAVGEYLRAVEAWWIDGNFAAGRNDCLARLDLEIAKLR
jgi:poly(A) polymerase